MTSPVSHTQDGAAEPPAQQGQPSYEMLAKYVPHVPIPDVWNLPPEAHAPLLAEYRAYMDKHPLRLYDWRDYVNSELALSTKPLTQGGASDVGVPLPAAAPFREMADALRQRYYKLIGSDGTVGICVCCAKPEEPRSRSSVVTCPLCWHDVCAHASCFGSTMCECARAKFALVERQPASATVPFPRLGAGVFRSKLQGVAAAQRAVILRGQHNAIVSPFAGLDLVLMPDSQYMFEYVRVQRLIGRMEGVRRRHMREHAAVCDACPSGDTSCVICGVRHCADVNCARYFDCDCGKREKAHLDRIDNQRLQRQQPAQLTETRRVTGVAAVRVVTLSGETPFAAARRPHPGAAADDASRAKRQHLRCASALEL